jgi:dihydrofolate reductase
MSKKKLELAIVAAMSNGHLIENLGVPENFFPLRSNLERLEKHGEGNYPVIIDEKTYEYEYIKKLLENRQVIALSENKKSKRGNPVFCRSVEQAIRKASLHGEMAYVMGRGGLLNQTIDIAGRIEVTRIKRFVPGLYGFPKMNLEGWKETYSQNNNDHSFHTYVKEDKPESAENPEK